MFAAGRYVYNYVDEKSEELGLSPGLYEGESNENLKSAIKISKHSSIVL